jgi:ectoine hydroxylase-related dioxygenase (phytanoyl-CoA dioxygenase family)
MESLTKYKSEITENGFAIISDVYTENEVHRILKCIDQSEQHEDSIVKTAELFAIRQLLKKIPELHKLLFNRTLKAILAKQFDSNYHLTKAIYFDKPQASNWFVPFHQDLSISVDQKVETDQYVNWTFKKGQLGVQPPLTILQNTITLRIHLDDTDENNGALKVIPKSHLKGIIRTDSKEWNTENERICKVQKGGVMLMKPLTLHASNRTTNGKRRRVVHLEFNDCQLVESLNWLEFLAVER